MQAKIEYYNQPLQKYNIDFASKYEITSNLAFSFI